MTRQPLAGIKVLDFSTLLPGPLCTLLLAEAGADVVKVEKPNGGDEMRTYRPRAGHDSINFALLNRGKRSLAVDLKSESGKQVVLDLASEADVLIEQFRPGVMQRLGLGYDLLAQRNPRLIYCSITGYGQTGPKSLEAAHDLNFMADSGLLGLSRGADNAPTLPPVLVADIAGGAYPAMMNVLLALRQRDMDGKGAFLDISMSDSLFTFAYWGLGQGLTGNGWPQAGRELVTGGSARYQIYRTADERFLAAAPIEDKFWVNFVNVLGLQHLGSAAGTEYAVKDEIAKVIQSRTLSFWMEKFSGLDTCVARVADLKEAVANSHFQERGIFKKQLRLGNGESISALPVPIVDRFRHDRGNNTAPELGNAETRFHAEDALEDRH